jgi:16S rRNA processing protein RimM
VTVAAFRRAAAGGLLRLRGVEDREGAEALRGARLEVAREAAPRPRRGSYYYFELVGCRCSDARAGDLGTVSEVREDGGGLMLRVVDGHGRELPIPWVEGFVRRVDVERRTIELALPEGFVEACASPS